MSNDFGISVLIPALNEGKYIGKVISTLKLSRLVKEILVIDHLSTDNTKAEAIANGAKVFDCANKGLGAAMKFGLQKAKFDWIFKCDADIQNPDAGWIERFYKLTEKPKAKKQTGLVKSYWNHNKNPRRLTTYVVRPCIKKLIPDLEYIRMPIAGIYLLKKTAILRSKLTDGWAFDLDVLINIHNSNYSIKQCFIEEIIDKRRSSSDISNISYEIISYLIDSYNISVKTTLMLVMAHPDDAEIWCGGTIIKYLTMGANVIIIIATGDEVRRKEALRLKEIFPKLVLRFLENEQFGMISLPKNVEILSKLIHQYKPDVLITHHFDDIHQDHRRCFELTTAGLMNLHRKNYPSRFLLCNGYHQADIHAHYFRPNVYIDISGEYEMKKLVIDNHKSQSTSYWKEMSYLIDHMNGLKSGVNYAEAFEICTYYQTPKAGQML